MGSSIVKGLDVEVKKVCHYKSEKFWGVCLRSKSCDATCKHEGFVGGACRGLRRRCYCFKPCP
ncbi:hypothetical protein ACJIZ3_019488 [Penstemon smallii]|uniref:Knottins-like domain-containing protein n=1 Tax=Penstemon smallii TaxID=265156 RepID=A0ABD3T223_9LAMI